MKRKIKIQDRFNESKVWVIKITNCNHYYLNQSINGRLFYKRFYRVTKKYIDHMLGTAN